MEKKGEISKKNLRGKLNVCALSNTKGMDKIMFGEVIGWVYGIEERGDAFSE